MAARASAPCLSVMIAGLALLSAPTTHALPGAARVVGHAGPMRITALDSVRNIDGNRINMVVTNQGSFALDPRGFHAGLIWPKGSDKTAVFAGGLWLGTAGGVNRYLTQPAVWGETVCADGFTDYTVHAVLPAGRTVWFGTAFGLSRRDLDTGRQV